MIPQWGEWWHELYDYGLTYDDVTWDVKQLKGQLKKGIANRVAAKILCSCCKNADTETNPEALQLLVDSGSVDVNAPLYDNGYTPIMIAGSGFSRGGDELIVKLLQILLRAGANIHTRNSEGFNTLMLCAQACSFDPSLFPVFNLLLENDSDVNLRVRKQRKQRRLNGFGVLELLYSNYPKFHQPEEHVRKKYVEAIFDRAEYRMSKKKRGSATMYKDLELFFSPKSAVILQRYLKKDKRFESEDLIKEMCSFVCYTTLIDAWAIPRKRKRPKKIKTQKKNKR